MSTTMIKENKILYEITDIRLLNQNAIQFLFKIFDSCCSDPECLEVDFDVTGMSQTELDVVIDIINSIQVKAKKRGKNGFLLNARLARGCHITRDGATKSCTFVLSSSTAPAIYLFAQGKTTINYFELMLSFANYHNDYLNHNLERM